MLAVSQTVHHHWQRSLAPEFQSPVARNHSRSKMNLRELATLGHQ